MKRNLPFYSIIALSLLSLSFGILKYVPDSSNLNNVLASIFDSDLIPKQTNSDIGIVTPDKRWRDGRFSGIMGLNIDVTRESEVNYSDRLVVGPTDFNLEGGQIKFLGPVGAGAKYTYIDNYNNGLRIVFRNGGVATSTRFTLADTGNVLIGTSTTMVPSEKLEVVGNIISKGTEWTIQTNVNNINNTAWNSVTYGNGLFVAVGINTGANPTAMYSADGVNWNGIATGNTWTSVTYGNGIFVAVGNGISMRSIDGKTWNNNTTPAGAWSSIAYGGGTFVAVGSNQNIITSSNGVNWVLRTSALPSTLWTSVAYGSDRFVAVSTNGAYVSISYDYGNTWTQSFNSTQAGNNTSIAYGNGIFQVVTSGVLSGNCPRLDESGCSASSKDGINWFNYNSKLPEGSWNAVAYGAGLFAAVGNPVAFGPFPGLYRIMTSPDGANWTRRQAPQAGNWKAVTYGNGLFVAVSNSGAYRVMTSGKMDNQVTPTNNIFQGGLSIMGSASGTLAVGTTTFAGLFTVATSSNIFTITYDGKMGIGTSTPQSALTIVDKGVMPLTYGGGGLSILQPDNSLIHFSYSVSNGSTSIGGYSDTGTAWPLTFQAGTTTFYTGAGTEAGSFDTQGNWYLGGTAATGIMLTGSSCVDCPANTIGTSTIHKTTDGPIGIGVNTTNGILSLGTSSGVGVLLGPPYPPPNLGTNWLQGTSTPNSDWVDVVAGKCLDNSPIFMMVGDGGSSPMATSRDGMNWTSFATTTKFTAVDYGVIGPTAIHAFVYTTTAGSNSGGPSGYFPINSSCGLDPPVPLSFASSPDGSLPKYRSIAYGTPVGSPYGIFVAVANSGYAGTSRIVWTEGAPVAQWYSQTGLVTPYSDKYDWVSVTYCDSCASGTGLFVALATNTSVPKTGHLIATSPDGKDWTMQIGPAVPDLLWKSITSGIVNGSSTLVVVGQEITSSDDGKLSMTSTDDGASWTQSTVTPPGILDWRSIITGIDSNYDALFVAVSGNGANGYRVMTSSDGTNWTIQPTPLGTLFSWTAIAFSGNMYVAVANGGANNRVMYTGVIQAPIIEPPAQKLWVLGDVRVGTSGANGCVRNYNDIAFFNGANCAVSDIRLKKNLVPLFGSLDKLVKLNPTYFDWRRDEYPEMPLPTKTRNLGLIAQDVEKVFPELVGLNTKGFKTLNYGVGLLMYEIDALKELKAENDSLQALVTSLEKRRGIINENK